MQQPLSLRFTGSGKEYFRIWIVNLMLTVLTLGIYSAWAKVRRLQYFDRNTELDGAVFDFTGKPMAILRGRIVALVLIGAYQYAIGFSLTAGVAVALGLLAALPFLMRGALRFRLSNTRYRGLRFQFTGSTAEAYATYLPLMAAVLLPAAFLAVMPEAIFVLPLVYLAWPLMHCVMKRYQHGNISFASLHSRIDLPKSRFYRPYLAMLGLSIVIMALAIGTVALAVVGMQNGPGNAFDPEKLGPLAVFAPLAMAYLLFVVAGPYIQTRTSNLAWSATSFPGGTIDSTMRARSFMKLQAINTVLTLLTLGLYRPFAVVKVYQYRLAHLSIRADATLDQALASDSTHASSASGNGVADFFDLDLFW